MNKINYKSPLYIQLREVIRSKIEEGEYPPGTAIPSEYTLAETYGINRLSVRNALEALEYEGLIKSVKGKGVFVKGQRTQRELNTLGGYRTTMKTLNKEASTKVLLKALRKAGPYYSRLLNINEDDDIWYIKRIDYSMDEPVSYEEIYIPYYIIPGLDKIDVQLFSIYEVYQWNNIKIESGDQILRIIKPTSKIAKHLGINNTQVVMEFSCITKDSEGKVIEFAKNYVRGDKTEFNVSYTNI